MRAGRERRGTLGFLRWLVVAAGLVLAVRVVQIQVFQHDHYLAEAEVKWTQEIPLFPERGNIYDRNGEPLALSVTSWRVGVSAGLAEDPQATAATVASALGIDADDLAARIRRAGARHLVIAADTVLDREQKLKLMADPAITLEDLRSRLYPRDAVGASLVGFFRYGEEKDVATGLESSLAGYLAGKEGLAREIKTPQRNRNLGHIVIQEPEHGKSVTLTLDAELQAICEEQLGKAVTGYGAQGGSVLVLDPRTGDVLAAASWPLAGPRAHPQSQLGVWTNLNFTAQYEPGSVFKIFTMASLLGNCAIDTATVFDCSDPDFGSFKIHNEGRHEYGDLPLMRAFSKSSNIYFARAVGNLSDQEFYRDLVDFGFGEPTNLPYGGQAGGVLYHPSRWSGRSKSTLAIGHELMATPIQLGMALCAVANGGVLYAPRLVRSLTDPGSQTTVDLAPQALRRIMSPHLTEVLREGMARVVKEGTGVAARLDWITTGGKTGTAQKAKDGRIAPGAYVASFAGLAPIDDPRLVVITVLDEPAYRYHFASQSAVPLFRDILVEVRNRTRWLTDVPGDRTATTLIAEKGTQVKVPDVLYLAVPNAAQRIAAAGLSLDGGERDGLVVQQVPAAGTLCPAGAPVSLTVVARRAGNAPAAALCPDFAGLSDRQVRSLAARLGVPVRIQGSGFVMIQDVAAGDELAGREVTVRMGGLWD
ncbi:MAG: penicillin-binding transpeptidase domain-containing protein [bacterium]